MLQVIQWLLAAGRKANKKNIQRSKAFVTEATSRDIVSFNLACVPAHSQDHKEENSEDQKNRTNSLGLLLGEGVDNSTAFFYGTLKHRILGLRPDFINTTVGICRVGGDVLPLCDASMSRKNGVIQGMNGFPKYKLQKAGGEKGKTRSKMKELLRWEVASNPQGEGSKRWKVLYFRNRGALGSGRYDGGPSNSSILSFKYDAGSRSSSSADSEHYRTCSTRWRERAVAGHPPPAKAISISSCIVKDRTMNGSWITTDSDYVVLEL